MSQGKLYTSYFAKLDKGIGIKYSIARFNPRWLNLGLNMLVHLPRLAPSERLLLDYKNKTNNLTWEDYEQRYRQESQVARYVAMSEIVELLNQGEDITLYCYETPDKQCHRHILAKMFMEKFGIIVEEIQIK